MNQIHVDWSASDNEKGRGDIGRSIEGLILNKVLYGKVLRVTTL